MGGVDAGDNKLSFDERAVKTTEVFVFNGGNVVYLNTRKTVFHSVIHEVTEGDVLPSVCGK
jgi:hypothetical protein